MKVAAADRRARGAAARLAARLARGARLFWLTDPARAPDVAAAAGIAPRGAVLIWRSYGAAVTPAILRARALARRRGVLFAVSADTAAARALKADALHLPAWSRLSRSALRRSGARLVSRSAHGVRALARAARDADAVLVSTVFSSTSPSAGAPMGPVRLSLAARRLPRRVAVALGGVTLRTAGRLKGAPLAGLAGVSWAPAPARPARPDGSPDCGGRGR